MHVVRRSVVFLVAMGAIVAGGLAMSMWGNQALFEDLVVETSTLGPSDTLEASVHMEEGRGVFAVEAVGAAHDTIHVEVVEPGGAGLVLGHFMENEAHEGSFDAGMPGEYVLLVSNRGHDDMAVTGYIGPEPDSAKRSIAFVSMYMLITGLVGMPVGIIWSVTGRRRR